MTEKRERGCRYKVAVPSLIFYLGRKNEFSTEPYKVVVYVREITLALGRHSVFASNIN